MIYLEEEQERLRKEMMKPMLLADEKPVPADPPMPVEEIKPPVTLPDNEDVKQILQGIIEIVLTDAKINAFNGPYGKQSDKRFTLVEGNGVAWPKAFRPSVPGCTYVPFNPEECQSFKPRMLKIRIDEFKWTAKKGTAREATIDVVLEQGFLGACHVTFHAKHDGKRWKVEWSELFTH